MPNYFLTASLLLALTANCAVANITRGGTTSTRKLRQHTHTKKSATLSPTNAPTTAPSSKPSASPTPNPSAGPTPSPSASPTASPSASPTPNPSASPTPNPSDSPTPNPTDSPSPSPTDDHINGGYSCENNNPCTDENIAKNHLYHEHADKENAFIQCSDIGGCFEQQCPEGLVWKQSLLVCDWPSSTTP